MRDGFALVHLLAQHPDTGTDIPAVMLQVIIVIEGSVLLFHLFEVVCSRFACRCLAYAIEFLDVLDERVDLGWSEYLLERASCIGKDFLQHLLLFQQNFFGLLLKALGVSFFQRLLMCHMYFILRLGLLKDSLYGRYFFAFRK